MISDKQHKQYLKEAHDLGVEHAKAAATWTTDGNADVEERRRVLEMLRIGDPAADDYLPRMPDLSGEFADDLTPARLYEEIIGSSPETDGNAVRAIPLCDALADAYENGVDEAFSEACEAELLTFCA